MGRISDPLPDPPHNPDPGPSKSITATPLASRHFHFRPPIPGAFLSPSIATPAQKLVNAPQTPQTEPRAEAMYNPKYRSMAPPPSPNLPPMPTPLPQPPDSGNSFEPRRSSTAASTTASISTLPASREEVDAAIVAVEKKLAGRVAKKVFSRKTARPHIYQSAHRARVLETRKEDQGALIKRLYELERAQGYSSDFQTFQGE
ncbi:hypothetical protein B0F90DRAFT_24726 [Multifurca ochricompacta]|uniref:Uncharacterized protein n=1 Tax=Multifurca ochricompacta TaxID=376703 RepID=A0AAD4MCE1_9AGAM|nr:hypothetical protein B0F90DRAFT_24726 [Multifurca ochricompacta]